MISVPKTLPILRDRIAGLLSQLRTLADSGGTGGALLAAMSEAETGGNIVAIKNGARGLAKAVEELQGQLRDALMQAEQLEPMQRRDILGSEAYWVQIKQSLLEAAARSPEAILEVWLKFFADAFAAWRLDICEQLTQDESATTPGLRDLERTLSLSIKALLSDDHAAAVPGLTLLVDEHPASLPRSPLDEESRAAVFLVLGRIQLHDKADHVAALAYFEKAREALPRDGRVHAALAEYYRMKNDDASAQDQNRRAIMISPDRPDGYVGMALSCETQGWWDEAKDWYSQAVDVVLRRAASGDSLAELGQLLAPVSGALYLRLSQAIATSNPTAGLSAIDQAIELGVKGAAKYPLRAAYELRGEIFDALQRPHEAAEAFFQAGRYYTWENNADVACKLFRRANGLDQQLVRNYWSWADALLMASYISKPPYVDPERIAESLDVWNRGVNLALPEEPNGWPYLTRAIIAQQLANLPGADRWERYWETVAFVEQALLLHPLRTYSWVTLSRAHVALGNDLCALYATEMALLCAPDDVGAVEQRMFVLSNLHQHADIWTLLDKRRKLEPADPALVSAIEAWLELREIPPDADSHAYQAPLAASAAAVKAGAIAPWFRVERARLLRLAGRTNESQQEYEKLWRERNEQVVSEQLHYAWAAMMCDRDDSREAALKILTARSGDRVSGLSTVQRCLGFCHLLREDLAAARDHFDSAIGLSNSASELDAWLISDLESAEVIQHITDRPHAEEARQMLDQCKKAAAARRGELQFPSTPLQELQRVIATLEASKDTATWNWIGAHAAAARLNLETRNWQAAEEIYRRLQHYPGRFFTAQHGLEQALYGLLEDNRSKTPLDARRTTADYKNILAAAASTLPEDRTRLADIHNQRANLERRRRPTRIFGQAGMQRLPAVTPIAIEAAGNLRSLLEGGVSGIDPQFAQLLSSMRWGLNDLLGFTAPSVRVRINESELPDGTYIIMINEIPLVSGNIDLTRGLCNETVDRLTLLNIKGQEAINPANGSECAWVNRIDWQKLKEAGYHIWTPAEYIVLHLSAVIRKNSTDLVGIQAVADLLQDKAKEHYSMILSAKGGLPRFISVIQALLSEEVPVKELPSICDCYLESQKLPTYDIPEEIRCLEAVRKDILGNTPDTPIYRLGENLVSLIAKGIQRDGEAAVLALEPEPTQAALTAVRNEVANLQPTTRNPVLFVEDWRMRPFVRKLVELEFPHLAVLSRREAVAPDSRQVLATIEVEPRPGSEKR